MKAKHRKKTQPNHHFFEGFFYFLFKGLKHSPKIIFRSFSSTSPIFYCSGPAVVGPLVFTAVMLLFVVLGVSFPCLPIFSSDWYSLVCQCLWWSIFQVLVYPRFRWLLLMLLSGSQFHLPCWSLCVPGRCSALPECSVIPRVIQACYHRNCLLVVVSAEIAALGLL